MLVASRLVSHSNGPGRVSSKSRASNNSCHSDDAHNPKFRMCASPHISTVGPKCADIARSAAMTAAAPRKYAREMGTSGRIARPTTIGHEQLLALAAVTMPSLVDEQDPNGPVASAVPCLSLPHRMCDLGRDQQMLVSSLHHRSDRAPLNLGANSTAHHRHMGSGLDDRCAVCALHATAHRRGRGHPGS